MNSDRTEHCVFAKLDNHGKCTAACYLNDGNTDCMNVERNTDPKRGAEVPLAMGLKLGGI